MKLFLFLSLCLCIPLMLPAQNGDFDFGNISSRALQMKRYDADTTASAVVLKEFGKTSIDNSQKNILVHTYHVRIKILRDQGIDKATFVIPVRKSATMGKEQVYDIRGSTFNTEGGSLRKSDLKQKNVFTENKSRYTDLIKFTLPGVRMGSVIEVAYTLSSPYIYNFREWKFQSDLPKMYSEYWAKIPANLDYNISLIGYLKLSEDKKSVIPDCLITMDGGKADCTLLKLGMKDIPAFKEEKYMTAKSNFLSAVHFELSEIHRFNGADEKVAKSWGDVDQQLRTNKDFGGQLKKGESFFRKALDTLLSGHAEEDLRARRIYAFMQKWYRWDGYTGIFCETGIKNAFEAHKGNIGDINLSLVAALRAAGLPAEPVLISTRDNGTPHDLYPVISDFNYVLARVTTPKAVYLLDASRPLLPFGVFPMACINGSGRVIHHHQPSEWLVIKAPVMRKEIDMAVLTLHDKGRITGTITRRYDGYLALAKRRDIHRFTSSTEYLEDLSSRWDDIQILADSIGNLEDPGKPLTETLKVIISGTVDSADSRIVINPFFHPFIRENPFKSAERHFPVDFGAPEQLYTVLTLHYPAGYHLVSFPTTTLLALPDKGGRYVVEKNGFGNTLILRTMTRQNQSVYQAAQYPALREFYNRIVQSHRADLIFSTN
jgi:hypothetical protein